MGALPVSGRLVYLDAARGILMMLGVLLHAARLYDPQTDWLLHDDESHIAFRYLTEFIHFFRMPAFFVVSGLFCALALEKYGRTQFLLKRLQRIVIPLLATALVVNIPMSMFLLDWVGREDFDWRVSEYWLNGRWVLHLWFLWFLVIFVVSAPVLTRSFFWQWLVRVQSRTWGATLFPLLFAAAVIVPQYFPTLYRPIYFLGSPSDWMRLCVFFYFGLLLGARPDWHTAFVNTRWANVVLSLLILWLCFYRYDFAGERLLQRVVVEGLFGAGIFVAIHLLMSAFFSTFSSDKRAVRYLADASFSVYLFHHGIVPVLGWLFIGLGLSIWFKFFLVVSVTIAISLWLHHYLVLRSPLLRYLFNGVSMRAPKSVQTLVA